MLTASKTNSTNDICSMYERNYKLLHKIAWGFSRSSGIEQEELFAEACLALVEAAPKYDSERGAESTFIWRAISNALQTYCNDERSHTHADIAEAEAVISHGHSDMENVLILKQSVAMLSEAAYQVTWLVANHPEVLGIEGTESHTKARGKVVKHLRNVQGLTWADTRETMRELRTEIAGVPVKRRKTRISAEKSL